MAKVYVGLNMFSLVQDIIFIGDNEQPKYMANAPTDKLGELVSNLAINNNVEEIDIDGNPLFAQQVIYDIQNILTTQYDKRNVRINLNGKIFNQ